MQNFDQNTLRSQKLTPRFIDSLFGVNDTLRVGNFNLMGLEQFEDFKVDQRLQIQLTFLRICQPLAHGELQAIRREVRQGNQRRGLAQHAWLRQCRL